VKQRVQQLVVAPFLFAVSALGPALGIVVSLGTLGTSQTAFAAATVTAGSVTGIVRDTSGTPQVGIVVELLRADSTTAARAFTDRKGIYNISAVLPGQYALKAVGDAFIPTLKQNLRIRANTVVNLTLNNLYDLMQLMPRPQRAHARVDDDWAWTLRSAESRPLLRWVDDGPDAGPNDKSPIVIYDGAEETSPARLAEQRRHASDKLRRINLKASAGEKRFGASPEQASMTMLNESSKRRRTAMSANISPTIPGMMDAMLGFRQEMASSGLGSSSVQTLAAVMVDPQAGAGGQQGLQTASLRTWESLELVNNLEAEAGSDQVLARVGDGATVMAALPFASLKLHRGQNEIEYRVASARTTDPQSSESMPGRWLPILSARDGQLLLEHGLHQELGWSTTAGPAEMQLVIYGDNIENPMIEGSGHLTGAASQWLLVDNASGLFRAAGPSYSTAGMLASVESRLPGHNHVKLVYASGDALVMQASNKAEPVAGMSVSSILSQAHARRAQMYSLMLSGTVDGTGTHWRASYRWQPEDTVTQVAPFAVDASEPYLNIYIRQPIHIYREGTGGSSGLEAQIDLRNLLAEGYQPFITSDGSQLFFAQAERSVSGGLAFTF
jgi:Carboxypeptidase regulatory-like domain